MFRQCTGYVLINKQHVDRGYCENCDLITKCPCFTFCVSLSSQVSVRVEGDRLSFSELESLLEEKADALRDLGFPISLVSQSESEFSIWMTSSLAHTRTTL